MEVRRADCAKYETMVGAHIATSASAHPLHDCVCRLLKVVPIGIRTREDDSAVHLRRVKRPIRDANDRVGQIVPILPGINVLKLLARVRLEAIVQHLERAVGTNA